MPCGEGYALSLTLHVKSIVEGTNKTATYVTTLTFDHYTGQKNTRMEIKDNNVHILSVSLQMI